MSGPADPENVNLQNSALIGFTEPLADEAGVNVEEYLDSHPNIRTAIHDNGCLEIVLDDRSLFLSPIAWIALSSK